ncbi:MAG: Gfo/Idh/MocA family oxidoreductase [Ferruginibacter sp.]
MNTIKNIGLIECGTLQKPLYISPVSNMEGYSIKKILSTGDTNEVNIKSRYPLAEIVDNTRDILDDNSIDLVIVSGPSQDDMGMVGEAIQAGKQIRII